MILACSEGTAYWLGAGLALLGAVIGLCIAYTLTR